MAVPDSHHTNGVQPSGDVSAFAQRRWLKTVLTARSGDPSVVEDLLQEVLLAAEKTRQNGNQPDDLRPWLYRVAVRQALLHRRKLGRQRRCLKRMQHERDFQENVSPHDWMMSRERSDLVRQALARLPPKDAEILMLKYSENWNYQQIAQHLGVSHSAVEGRLHRARKRLRIQLIDLNLDETNP